MDTVEFILYINVTSELSTYIDRSVDLELFIPPHEC